YYYKQLFRCCSNIKVIFECGSVSLKFLISFFKGKERKAFLRRLGLPRHEAYELALSTEFDVKHYEKMLYDMIKNGERAEFINACISDNIKGLSCDNYDLNCESNFHNSTENNVPPPPPRMLNWESDTAIDVDQIPDHDEAPTTSKEANKSEGANGSEKLSKCKRRKKSYFLRLGFQNEAAHQLAKDGYSKKSARRLGTVLNIIPYRIAILPCDYPETLLFTEHMDQIQSILMTKLSSEHNQSALSTLSITNIVYKAGFMSIDCKNDEAMVKWLLLNVRLIQLGEDIELMAIQERTMPDPFICVGIFKNASNLGAKEILRNVQATNNGLSVRAWRTLKTVFTGNATKLVLAVDPKSAEIIQEKNNFITYNGHQVHLKHQKSLKPYLRSDPQFPSASLYYMKRISPSINSSSVSTETNYLKPELGFCIKTFKINTNEKYFINVCQTEEIPAPDDVTEDQLTAILNSDEPSSFRIPMSISEPRITKDKSDKPVDAVDIAVNPKFFSKIEKSLLFRDFFLALIAEALNDKYNVQIKVDKAIILNNRKFIGALVTHRVRNNDIKTVLSSYQNPSNEDIKKLKTLQASSAANKTLIEEIDSKEFNALKKKSEEFKQQNSTSIMPEYKLRARLRDNQVEEVQAEFYLPKCLSSGEIALDIGEDRILLESAQRGYLFDKFVNYQLNQDRARAIFDKTNKVSNTVRDMRISQSPRRSANQGGREIVRSPKHRSQKRGGQSRRKNNRRRGRGKPPRRYNDRYGRNGRGGAKKKNLFRRERVKMPQQDKRRIYRFNGRFACFAKEAFFFSKAAFCSCSFGASGAASFAASGVASFAASGVASFAAAGVASFAASGLSSFAASGLSSFAASGLASFAASGLASFAASGLASLEASAFVSFGFSASLAPFALGSFGGSSVFSSSQYMLCEIERCESQNYQKSALANNSSGHPANAQQKPSYTES
uniref:PIH1 domain-containing protein 1 n=1 Tax=Glossina austeni TaxID=7395 RepID=A0A1A9VMF6_GLOAU